MHGYFRYTTHTAYTHTHVLTYVYIHTDNELESVQCELAAARHCKFYRPDKSGLVDGARKDTLLCIYILT